MMKMLIPNLSKPLLYVLGLLFVFLFLISSMDVRGGWFIEDIIDRHYDHRPKSMEMHLRKLRMLQTCKKYGAVLRAPEMLSKRNTLIWDLRDSLIYCRIAKVASSTWTTNMLRLDPAFNSEFIDYVVAETAELVGPRDWKGVMTWKSYYAKCLPCDVKYDAILKLESHTEDEKWLINTRNLTLLSRVRDWRHLSSSSTTRHNLISQLSNKQLQSIYKNYQIDFEMFNYAMDKYLKSN